MAKKGGGAVGPLPRFFGGFDIVYRGQPEVIMDPKRKSRRSKVPMARFCIVSTDNFGKGSDKYRLPNIEKYLTAKTGNPTEKWTSDRDMRS